MKSLYYRLAAALLVFIGGVSTSLATTKLYMEDFSITPGETKTVAVCLDTDVEDITTVAMKIILPNGLEFVTRDFGNGKQIIDATVNNSRAATFSAIGDPETGKISLSGIRKITAGTGELFSIKLTATNELVSPSVITLDEVQVLNAAGEVATTVGNATVTISDATPKAAVSFAENEIIILAGATGTVDVNMTNTGVNVSAFQADVVLPERWTSVVTTGRLPYNAGDDTRIMYYDFSSPIPGEEGALFTLSLTAPADFDGEAEVKLTGIYVTQGTQEVELDDITLKVKAHDTEAIQAFDTYKAEQIAVVEALAEEGDSEASQQIIAEAKAAIEALTYDETKTLDENKALVDAIVSKATEDLEAQRAEDVATTVEALVARYGNSMVVYNLNGQKVSAAQLSKGVYVINGKKVYVK